LVKEDTFTDKTKLIIKMGASTSKNISSIITNAVAKVSSEIVQKTSLSADSSQVISVSDVAGDVNVSGNKFTQKATINMTALFDALAQEENQQKILIEVAQQSKSLTKDLNLVQYADAQNIVNTVVNATVSILSKVSQNCKALTSQTQEIIIERIYGNVNILNNVEDQVSKLFEECTEKTVVNEKLTQDLANLIDQAATSTIAGLSPWAIAGIIAAVLGLPVLGVSLAIPKLLKFLFPIFILVGLVLIVMYSTRTKDEMKLTSYSEFILKNCQVVLDKSLSNVSAEDAANACSTDSNCVGFDWKTYDINENGFITTIPEPFVQLYSSIEPKDCKVSQDKSNIFSIPQATQGTVVPNINSINGNIGDIYLLQTTGIWYQRTDKWPTGWQPMKQFTSTPFTTISWGFNDPPGINNIDPATVIDESINIPEGTVYIQISKILQNFTIYRVKGNKWQNEGKQNGPGVLFPGGSSNTSGIKTVFKPTWMLYAGIAFILTGIVGLFVSKNYTEEKYTLEECKTYPFKF